MSILDEFIGEDPLLNFEYLDMLEYELYLQTFEDEFY